MMLREILAIGWKKIDGYGDTSGFITLDEMLNYFNSLSVEEAMEALETFEAREGFEDEQEKKGNRLEAQNAELKAKMEELQKERTRLEAEMKAKKEELQKERVRLEAENAEVKAKQDDAARAAEEAAKAAEEAAKAAEENAKAEAAAAKSAQEAAAKSAEEAAVKETEDQLARINTEFVQTEKHSKEILKEQKRHKRVHVQQRLAARRRKSMRKLP